jgi:hypothetical protein
MYYYNLHVSVSVMQEAGGFKFVTALTFVETHCVDNPWHLQQIGLRVTV